MRFLVVHLSDLHIKTGGDPILERHGTLFDSVKNLSYDDLAGVILLLSGDIAFSGEQAQYEAAAGFLTALSGRFANYPMAVDAGTTPPVFFALAPGNHDCSFPDDPSLREAAITAILTDQAKAQKPSLVEACLGPLTNFFAFRDRLSARWLKTPGSPFDQRLAYRYEYNLGGRKLHVLCLNTAWLSQKRERQGTLLFPEDAIPPRDPEAAATIAVLHHPYGWILSDNARRLRRRLQSIADAVVTGHEHDPETYRLQDAAGETTHYVEGGVLQDPESTQSSFHALLFDLAEKQQRVFKLSYTEPRYELSSDTNWVKIDSPSTETNTLFEPTPDMTARLTDPGLSLTPRGHDDLRLQDFFLYPDLREVAFAKDATVQVTRGEDVPQLLRTTQFALILGDDQSGKTSIAKMTYLDLLSADKLPLLVDGAQQPPKGEGLYGWLERHYEEQYGPAQLAAFRQLDKQKRTIIVDDYHRCPIKLPQERRAFLEGLRRFAGQVIVLAHDLATTFSEVKSPDGALAGDGTSSVYRILPFGHARRTRFVERWLQLRRSESDSQVEFLQALDTISDLLRLLIGRNNVPAYPVFLLSVLQASEVGTPIDTKTSALGHYYEVFVKAALCIRERLRA